ncbi:uncharacterized protein LOC116113397 isoform X3 [Pistacia vera]|nr:uncharacterized protein LOC116113397 isoform X3 [Pistacia vera]
MGSQIPMISDRTRVIWTAAMEHYFIDLMLDQLHRGNRLGHTFNKQAWTDMMTLLNAKFGTRYDRDTLKSHYSILWKQYNDVKNLLEQNGFYWDDTRKMVIADEHVWDAYIKANPDVQAFRNRALTYFDNLCYIYGYTQADGRYSRSSHDIDLDDDVQVVHTGFEIGSIAPESREPAKKAEWTLAMDQYFIDLMLDQVRKGSTRKHGFSKQAWKEMLILFNAKFCSQYHKRFLRYRYKKLFKYYADLRTLLNQKGFSWDEKRQMIVADDSLWDKYVKAYPHACSYRNRTLLNYQDLELIYAYGTKNGPSVHICQDKNLKDYVFQVKTGEEKEGYSSAGSDGFGAVWTPIMDCYLLDLLLDQALRGNKIGLSFISEAWMEMVTVFNHKFKSHYDVDVLKKRHKHLRWQYNDIKILLEQNGFFWDDMQEMLIAEDYVWDSYVEAHPDAQLYRNKSVPSYHKLCVIYGQESSNGRSGHLADSVDIRSADPDLMIGEDLQFYVDRDCSRTDWTPLMDRHLIDLMLEQVQSGNRIGYTFKNEAWIDMAVSFVERFGLKYDKDLLKVHHKSLEKQYYAMKNLLEHRGFSWDERRQMVTAYGDVWDAYIKEHPDAKSYKTKPTPNYYDLCLIYGNSTSNGMANRFSQDLDCNGHGAKSNNGYCSRTDWTLPMDRYFIDLMLQQVRQGSLIDQKFSKQAWADMVAKFRAEFGSQYSKDVLKSRYINLRKRFIDMKNLLDQSGFCWNEMRQMIVANRDLWDAYVKVYPDAQPYRNRTLPNYNDLFLIYGNANTDMGENHFSQSMETDYAVGVKIGEEDDQYPDNSSSPRIHWTKTMDRCFIDLMLEQVHRGNKIGHRFSDQAWAWIVASFNEQFGFICDREVLEERYFSLMNECNSISNLLSPNCFMWDDIQQTMISDDDVWEAHIKEHPDAVTYEERNLSNYNDLHMIYGNKSSDRRLSSAGVKIENDDNIFRDLCTPAAEFDISEWKKKRKSASSSTRACPRKIKKPMKEIQETPDEMPSLVKTWAGNKEIIGECSSIKSVVDALQAVPGMDDETFLEACQLLEDEKKAKMFVQMDVNQRRKWLIRKLRR